jgi:hypothetical protein
MGCFTCDISRLILSFLADAVHLLRRSVGFTYPTKCAVSLLLFNFTFAVRRRGGQRRGACQFGALPQRPAISDNVVWLPSQISRTTNLGCEDGLCNATPPQAFISFTTGQLTALLLASSATMEEDPLRPPTTSRLFHRSPIDGWVSLL